MVHLAQDFVMSLPLIDGQGNFGSVDGDRPASVRYTEARLKQVSEYLLQDYEKDTVLMRYNYDETCQIPSVLPAQFPNLLVNGSSGIAVGMATSIPPHNLGEVIDALIAILDNEELSLQEIMQYIKGPDFPTGGEFYGGSTLVSGYETGRGKVILQGTCFEEEIKGRQAIIIDALPYQIVKPRLIERITQLITEGALEDIFDVRDESGKHIRVVLELKKDANIEIVKQRLFALTQMRVSISMNMVAIHEQKPITFALKQMLDIFLHFRQEVVQKRAEYILNKTANRAHIMWGLALATDAMSEIIATIRGSSNAQEAEDNLMKISWQKSSYENILKILNNDENLIQDPYHFSKEQARGILELRLHKLTKLEQSVLLDDLKELGDIMAEQKKIIKDTEYRKELMKKEFLHIKEKFATARRTKILFKLDDLSEESLIALEEIVVMTTANGYIKRINLEEYRVQNRGGKGKIGHKKIEDPIANVFFTNTLSQILFFSSKGKVFALKAYELPEGSSASRGRAAINLFSLDEGEKITTILPLEESSSTFLVFITKDGTVRRNNLSDFSNIRINGKIAMKLEDGNFLHTVFLANENDELLLTSSHGNSIRFGVSDVRVFESRSSQGVTAMSLQKDDYIIGAARISCEETAEILCITENGYGKRTVLSEYRKIKRGGKGVKSMSVNKKTGRIIEAMVINQIDDILILTKHGKTIRVNVSDIRKTSRVTSGVIVMKLEEGDSISQAISVCAAQEEDI
jgi:DNA gyrase subunit A